MKLKKQLTSIALFACMSPACFASDNHITLECAFKIIADQALKLPRIYKMQVNTKACIGEFRKQLLQELGIKAEDFSVFFLNEGRVVEENVVLPTDYYNKITVLLIKAKQI